MSDAAEPICFYCGQEFRASTQLNRTADGRACPICSDRLMESLPALLPAGGPAVPIRAGELDEDRDGESESEQGREWRAPAQLRAVQDRPEPA